MKRLLLNISTTAGVVLFTIGALSMLESENYVMTGVFFFFAFWLPANNELNTIINRRFGIGTATETDTETETETDKGIGSEAKNR